MIYYMSKVLLKILNVSKTGSKYQQQRSHREPNRNTIKCFIKELYKELLKNYARVNKAKLEIINHKLHVWIIQELDSNQRIYTHRNSWFGTLAKLQKY